MITRQNLPTLHKKLRSRLSVRDTAMKGAFADSKNLGGAPFVVADLTERKLDIGPFHFIQGRALAKTEYSRWLHLRHWKTHLWNSQRGRKVAELQGTLASADNHPFQHVAQFPDIAGPRMQDQSGQYVAFNGIYFAIVLGIHFRYESICQGGNIFLAMP